MKRAVLAFLILIVVSSCFAKYSGGSGTADDPYQITTAADLLALAADTGDYDANFILTADIDLDPNLPGNQVFTTAVIARNFYNDPGGWVNLYENAFTGIFDGAGHKIINLTIDANGTGNDFLGLFGSVKGTVKNLGLENVSITGEDSSIFIAGLVGINGGNIIDCHSTGTITCGNGSSYIGGLVSYNDQGNISNCYSTGDVNGHAYVGGLVGSNEGGSISNCYSTGAVTGGSYVGGLVGFNYGWGNNHIGAISNCYSTGNVTGYRYVGGLMGVNDNGSISNCYSTGAVSGTYWVGGLVGNYTPSSSINSSYFLITSGPNNGYGTPLTDAQMKQQNSFVGWDFVWETANGPNDIWAICEGVSYPKLSWQFIVGDSDNDKDVDFVDFAAMGLKWQQADSTLYCGGTDLAGDGLVDLADLAVFVEHWLQGL